MLLTFLLHPAILNTLMMKGTGIMSFISWRRSFPQPEVGSICFDHIYLQCDGRAVTVAAHLSYRQYHFAKNKNLRIRTLI